MILQKYTCLNGDCTLYFDNVQGIQPLNYIYPDLTPIFDRLSPDQFHWVVLEVNHKKNYVIATTRKKPHYIGHLNGRWYIGNGGNKTKDPKFTKRIITSIYNEKSDIV